MSYFHTFYSSRRNEFCSNFILWLYIQFMQEYQSVCRSTNLYADVSICAHSGSILSYNKLPAELKFDPVNGLQTGRPMWRRLIGNSVQTPHNHAQPLVLISHCFAPFGSSPCSNTCCHSNILCGCTDIPTASSAVVAWMLNKFRSLITSVHFYQIAKLSKCTTAL
jgi:hypothetical protein